MDCPVCGGPGTLLGFMGRFCWLRCRNCGHDFVAEEAED